MRDYGLRYARDLVPDILTPYLSLLSLPLPFPPPPSILSPSLSLSLSLPLPPSLPVSPSLHTYPPSSPLILLPPSLSLSLSLTLSLSLQHHSVSVRTDGTRSLEENMRQTVLACYRELSEILNQLAITHVS